MGQCMQAAITNSRIHPYLGYLTETDQSNIKHYHLSFPVANEEEYISWSKNIHKLRCNSEVKTYLYLPIREKFNQSDNLCQSMSRVELTFLPFYESLKQTLTKNITNRRYFHESYLWYLIYVLVKCIKHYQKRQQPISTLRFQNLLIFNDGSIKLIPEDIIPNQDLSSTIYADLQIEEDNTPYHYQKTIENLSEVYIAGIICLSVADLLHPVLFFNKNNSKWGSIGDQTRKEALKNCQKRYSGLLVQTLTQLTQKSKDKQIKIETLYKRLQLFENQILAKKQLGLGLNLGYSSIESIKTSYCVDNKTAISNNNSNMLRLSTVQNQSTTPSNRSMKHQEMDQIVYEEDDDYLNIL